MIVTKEPLDNRQLAVTIEVDEERTQQGMRRAARNISREVRIRGFRRGKAPYEAIVQRFGEDTVRREAADLLAEEIIREALSEEGIDTYAPGELNELTLDPLTYKLTVPLAPTVDLGDYRSYRRETEEAEVAEEQIEQALSSIREENTIFESVERPATWEDGIALDLHARTDDGTEVLKGEDLHLVLEAGSTDPVPGFPEAIEGMRPGEERAFTLTLPVDFPQEAYAGQEAEFTVKVTDVYNQIVPDLDDDLARTVGSYESLEALKNDIRDRLRSATQQQKDREYASQVVEAIVDQAEVDYPPIVLERELDQVVEEAERSIKSQRRLSLEDFLRIEGKTKEEFREEMAPRAEERIARGLVLAQVVKLEGLKLDEGEIEQAIEQTSASWGSRGEVVRKSFESDAGRRAMANRILTDKAVQRLVAIAKGEAGEAEPEDEVVGQEAREVGGAVDEVEAEESAMATVEASAAELSEPAAIPSEDGEAGPVQVGEPPADVPAEPGADESA